jgi:hypothetical protein
LDEKVAPGGSGEAVKMVIASSGSLALTVNVIKVPSAPVTVAGAVTTGGWKIWPTVIEVVAEPVSAFDAVKVAE